MKPKLRNILWCVLALSVAACIARDLWPKPKTISRLSSLPLKGLGFTGQNLALNPAEVAVYQRASVLKRLYQAGASQFVLIAIDGSDDRHAIHDPLYCFRGAGWTVTREDSTPLPGGSGKRVRLTRGTESTEALYWISDGEHRHASALKGWWQSVKDRLGAGNSKHTPILMVLQPAAGKTIDWDDVLVRFTELSTI